MAGHYEFAPGRWALGRYSFFWAWWFVPVAEVVLLSLCIDTGAIAHNRSWWAGVVGNSGKFASIAFISIAAGVLIGYARGAFGRQTPSRPVGAPAAPVRHVWPIAIGHFAALIVFVALSERIFRVGQAGLTQTAPWVAAWVICGLVTAGLWCLAALPASRWIALARRWWREAVAAVAVGACAWGAGALAECLWATLCGPTFWVVRRLLGLISSHSVADPATFMVGISGFRVVIARACSGYEGIGLILVTLTAYLWLFRRRLRFPHALLLLPIGTALIWLANALRITLLVVVGAYASPKVALGGFHSQVGWLMFIAVGLGLMVGAQRMSLFCPQVGRARPGATVNPTAVYLLPILVMILAKMLTAAASSGFDRFYLLSVIAVGVALWGWWPRVLRALADRSSWSLSAVGIGVGVFGIWLLMEHFLPAGGQKSTIAAGLAGMPGWLAGAWLGVRVLGAVVTVPIVEELAFRGYLMRRLISADFEKVSLQTFSWIAVIVSSAAFGVLHGRWIAGTLAGGLLAWAAIRRGRLADAVVAHASANALLAVYVLATGSWSLW